ncbi:MAG: DUF4159 domain-containing protein [Planctomycetota bacterium]|nr:DUF4159 domain-containing protein [Planctomycetota bacterium]
MTANPENLRATDSMTAAAIASALITYAALNHSREFPCGSDRVLLNMVEEGLEWFGERETRVMPTRISSLTSHTTYRMYAKERVGFYTGLRLLGGIDWYNEGTRLIIECNRSAENNGWKDVPGAAFAVMSLSKGRWPIVVQKLKWGDGWNDDALDMLRLTEKASEIFEDKEMERLFTSETAYMPTPRAGKRCTWRTVTFETPFDILMEVPILYIVGKKFPEFSEEQADILERYALSGGTILAVAGCGEKEFDEGLRKFVAEKFSGYEFTVLDRDHPLYSSWYRSSLAYEPLHAIIGPHGRPMILYSEDGISCDWEGGHIDSKESRLGISIIKYISDLVPGIWH